LEQTKNNKSKHQYENLSLGTSFADFVVPISGFTEMLSLFDDFLPLLDLNLVVPGPVMGGVSTSG